MYRARFRRKQFVLVSIAWLAMLVSETGFAQDPVDLSSWGDESYPAVSGFGAGVWTVSGDGSSVLQSVNGQPTLFYSDFNAFNSELEGVISPGSGGDDDYIGFALGFLPGDATNPGADYLLIDWKGGTQNYNFGVPSCTPGGTAEGGLAVSRATGVPTADEFWSHENFDTPACSGPDSGLVELARGNTLGNTGWQAGEEYTFRFQFTESSLRIYVDDVLELDIAGSFSDGRFAFYNFSQANVTYRGFQRSALGPVAQCQDVTVLAESGCEMNASIDDGSFDPDGTGITLTQSPPGPYPVGETEVTLTVTNEAELSSECTAVVTVTENVPPEITCPEDMTLEVEGGKIDGNDARLAGFVATAIDNCDQNPMITDDAPQTYSTGTTLVMFTATDESGNQSSCSAQVTISDVPAGMERVQFDLHPGSCVNPLQVRKQGVIPAAVLGTEGFDVRDIDVATLLLEGIAPVRSGYEDVSTASARDSCECTPAGEDGYEDLTLKFSAPEIVPVLGDVMDGEDLALVLTGQLKDGTPFEAVDCMVIRANGNGGGRPTSPEQIRDRPALVGISAEQGNSTQVIRYSLPEAMAVTLTVFDLSGRLVDRLVSGTMPAGVHTASWDAGGRPNGIYFYRLVAGTEVFTRKVALLR